MWRGSLREKLPRKTLLIMRFSIVLLFGILFQVSAGSLAQKVVIQKNQMTYKALFKEIEKQTGLITIYNNSQVDMQQIVELSVAELELNDLFREILKDKGLSFEVVDDYIVIRREEKTRIVNDLQQKNITISGTIKDESGQPIPGVNIIVVEYNNGTITNENGIYKVLVPDGRGTLKFSFIGFVSQEIAIDGQQEINVILKEEVSELDDVVITGYFQQSKKSFTGSVTQVDGDKLLSAGSQNILKSLQLIDPGFMQIENDLAGSNPNVMPEFNIRGTATVDMQAEFKSNPNMPTFILDGFEVSAEKIWDMDPYRVASINILKDAAATAIYGSRASNGVVVITTKSPKKGTINITYNSDFELAFADLSDYDLLNAAEKLELEVKDNQYTPTEYTRSGDLVRLENIYNEKYKLVQKGYDTYWLDKPINNTKLSQNHSLTIEGGNEAFRYGINMNYDDQNGIMIGSGRDRFNIGMNLQYNYKNISFRNNITYDQVKSTNSPYGSYSQYAEMNPYYRIHDEDGNSLVMLENTGGETYWNPLHNAELNLIDEDKYNQIINNFEVDYRFNNGLRAKASISLNKKTNSSDLFKPASHTDFIAVPGQSSLPYEERGLYTASNGELLTWETKFILSYFKEFDKHVINANLIYNAQESTFQSRGFTSTGYPNDQMDDINFGMIYEKDAKPQSSETISRLMGAVMSVNYSYDNRYMCDFSFRSDASSAYGLDHNWAPFWAAGIGWNVHEENMLKESNIINELKLRGSYGYTGTISFDPYQSMRTYSYDTDNPIIYSTGVTMMGIGNDRLSWQRTLKRNLGIDFGLINNRLSGNVNYYNDLSKDLLVSVTLPPSLGFGQYSENLGEVQNTGYELNLQYRVIKNQEAKLYLDIFVGAMHNENKLMKISDYLSAYNDNQDNDMLDTRYEKSTRPRVRYVEGQSMSAIWANKSFGIDPATGDEIFLTKSGGTTFDWDPENYMVCGDSQADVLGNFGTNFTYKGWRLNAYFNYRLGGEYYNTKLVNRVENVSKYGNTDRRVLDDRWQEPGDVSFYKDIDDDAYTQPTSRFIQKYNYLQLSSVNISYDFDTQWMKRVGLKRLQLNCYMNDIFRTSTVKVERGTEYPFQRSVSFGLRASF